jgi:prevent-host-death family protein
MNESRDLPASELRAHLAEHLDRVRAGEMFVVCRNGRPTAWLGPIEERSNSDDGE